LSDLFALAERHARDLRIEQRKRRLAGEIIDDFDVLPAGMEHLEHVFIVHQQVEQGRQVDARRLGIDRGRFLVVGDLDQAQVRPIGVLAHKFRIDRDEIGPGEPGAKLGQGRAVGNQRMNLHKRCVLTMGRCAVR